MGFSRQEYWSGVPLPSPKPTLLRYKIKINKDETPASGPLKVGLLERGMEAASPQKQQQGASEQLWVQEAGSVCFSFCMSLLFEFNHHHGSSEDAKKITGTIE